MPKTPPPHKENPLTPNSEPPFRAQR